MQGPRVVKDILQIVFGTHKKLEENGIKLVGDKKGNEKSFKALTKGR